MRVSMTAFPYSGGFTLKVNRNGRPETVEVTADGEGFCSQAGALLLTNLCDRLGLTKALGEALAPTRQRQSVHDDGEILRNLIVTLAQGGEHLSDQAALRDQSTLFGEVASDATAFRAIERIGPAELEGIKAARKLARERAFEAAEDVRLLYVAATRAAEELVVARQAAKPNKSPWHAFEPWLDEHGIPLSLVPAAPPERERLQRTAESLRDEAARAAAAPEPGDPAAPTRREPTPV